MYHDVSDDVVLLIVTCDTFEITALNDSQDL